MKNKLNPFPILGPYAGIYSHGVQIKNTMNSVYVSGQVGQDNDGNLEIGFKNQCRKAIDNVRLVLQEADMELDDIVKMNIYLTCAEDMQSLVEVRKELLDGVAPAITTLFVSGLVNPAWLVEIDVVAAR